MRIRIKDNGDGDGDGDNKSLCCCSVGALVGEVGWVAMQKRWWLVWSVDGQSRIKVYVHVQYDAQTRGIVGSLVDSLRQER